MAVTFIDVTAPLAFVITFAVALPPLVDDITTVSELDKPNPADVTWMFAIDVVAGYTSNTVSYTHLTLPTILLV